MAAASAAKLTGPELKTMIDSSLAGQDQTAYNQGMLTARFLEFKAAIDADDNDAQRRLADELIIITATWIKIQSQEIASIKAAVSTGGQGPKRPIRISESRGASNLKVFSGDKKEFNEWLEKLINQFTVIHPKSREVFKDLVVQCNTHKKVPEKPKDNLPSQMRGTHSR